MGTVFYLPTPREEVVVPRLEMPRKSSLSDPYLASIDSTEAVSLEALGIERIAYCLSHDMPYGFDPTHEAQFLRWLEGRTPCGDAMRLVIERFLRLHDGRRIAFRARRRTIETVAWLVYSHDGRVLSVTWRTKLNRA